MNQPTYYFDQPAAAVRIAEVPNAAFGNGVNAGGSNAPGIGIATAQPDLTGNPESWTLLDQYGDARTPQNSQPIGGSALGGGVSGKPAGRAVIVSDSDAQVGDGAPVDLGAATLADLATGWAAV